MQKNRILALISIGIFIFMSTLDGSIVNVALPTMSRELQVSLAQVTWVVTIYLIVISAVILIFGRLGDLLGKANVFRTGAIIFTIGSFLAGINLGWGLPFLLFARIVQAVGGSMFMATSFGLVAQIFPPETRARAMAINSMFVSVGSIAGPAIGGLILQITSWNYIFWINVPVGIIAYFLGSHALPKEKAKGSVQEVDFIGSALMALTIVFLFLGINYGQIAGWSNPFVIGAIILAVILFVLFIRTENRKSVPLIDLGIFKSKLFSLSVLTAMLNFTAAMFVNILMPFFLQDYHGLSAGVAGLMMTAYPVAMLISSPISGVLSDKYDKELITFIGISGIIIAQLGYLSISGNTPYGFVIAALALHGLSVGFFQSPNNALVMSTVDKKYLGIAGSVNSLARNIAFVLGTSLATISLFFAMSSLAGRHITTYIASQPKLFLDGMHISLFVSLVLVIITWILSLMRMLGNRKAKKTV
ncbi:DHA2 family efflux MFS transporter permease subunit [Lactococcus termiticola]|uniref:Major facilitator superfamily transporter n=1 Tax=Lactococcus termiticola TaxID=2169526 RepID=A0A2R5HDH0_9LACT|nr:DHA2 family efflux MFS transporter permease subunit [Lactococcus termiticola]GBG96113.1 major facilitator superfamily transporter [Lactococcus termiticola]